MFSTRELQEKHYGKDIQSIFLWEADFQKPADPWALPWLFILIKYVNLAHCSSTILNIYSAMGIEVAKAKDLLNFPGEAHGCISVLLHL